MFRSLIAGFRKQNQERDQQRGWDYAKEQHEKFGDDHLYELERQCYGQSDHFDRGINSYIATKFDEIELGLRS